MTQKLSNLKINQQGKIVFINGDIHLKRRIMELGFVTGQTVKILSISPLKNSYLISIKSYTLALRKDILENVFVEIWYG